MKTNLLLTAFIIISSVTGSAQDKDVLALDAKIKEVIGRCYAATVHVSSFDSGRTRMGGMRASGVVVSADGLVLTAGHVTYPNRTYLLTFPDGKQLKAKGLGRIGQLDVGLMKIVDKGLYPHVEMGRSAVVRKNDPCISIAYPGSLTERVGVVRFGYVSEPQTGIARLMKTTCLMESGDSGGPVFDLSGRVIGVHSRIHLSLEDNFEVPIDHFRKYWTALQRPVNYSELPSEDPLPTSLADEKKGRMDTRKVLSELSDQEEDLDQYCIQLNSYYPYDTVSALGTLVDLRAFGPSLPALQQYSYVISKSSQVGEAPVAMMKGKRRAVKILIRDLKRDLVLLQLDRKIDASIAIGPEWEKDTIATGTFLLSPHPQNEGEVSVAGTAVFDLSPLSSSGFLGVRLETMEGRNVITMVQPNSAASAAGLATGDELLRIDGVQIDGFTTFSNQIRKKLAQESIVLVRARRNSVDTLNIQLRARPMFTGFHIGELFTDGKSERRDGFRQVFVHDGKLKPSECGGPIFDLHKKFVGINMARYSRTSSIGLPVTEVVAFVEEAVRNVREQ